MTDLINRIAECVYHLSSLDGYTLQEAEEQTRETLKTDPGAVLSFLQDAAADGDTEAGTRHTCQSRSAAPAIMPRVRRTAEW